MNSRKQISVIDAIMSLIYDIQLVKYEDENTLMLFINIKNTYNHVSAN